MLVTEDIYKNCSRKIVNSFLAQLSKEEILLSPKLSNLRGQLDIFSTITLYPQLHLTSILSPLHALNHWPHVEATYYCMFLLVSHISQS
jgi:hypothetical protein